MAQPTETYRTSITIAGEVASAALTACEPENENRNFSNLCEVSLRAYLEPRGYLAPSNTAEHRERLVQVVALLTDEDFAGGLDRLLRRHARKQLATEGAR